MSATAASNQPMSITTRSAIAARSAQAGPIATGPASTRPTLIERLRAGLAASRRRTPFANLSTSARREFADTPGLRRRSAPTLSRSSLDTFMR